MDQDSGILIGFAHLAKEDRMSGHAEPTFAGSDVRPGMGPMFDLLPDSR